MNSLVWIIPLAIIVLFVVVTLFLPRTRSLRLDGHTNTPVERLFAEMTNLSAMRGWFPGLDSADHVSGRDGPARRQRLGYAENGRKIESLQQVTTWVPDVQYGWKHLEDLQNGKPIRSQQEQRTVITLHREGEGVRIEVVSEWTAAGFFARWKGASMQRNMEARARGMLSNLENLPT